MACLTWHQLSKTGRKGLYYSLITTLVTVQHLRRLKQTPRASLVFEILVEVLLILLFVIPDCVIKNLWIQCLTSNSHRLKQWQIQDFPQGGANS